MIFGGCSAIIHLVREHQHRTWSLMPSRPEQEQYINLGERAFPALKFVTTVPGHQQHHIYSGIEEWAIRCRNEGRRRREGKKRQKGMYKSP
jgi:hypothetical protein